MRIPCSAFVVLAVVGCHARPRARPPSPPPEARVATAMAAWGQALRDGDKQAVLEAEDPGGRTAFVYLGVKAAASQLPDGAEAVEHTVFGIVLMGLLGAFDPDNPDAHGAFSMVLPTGSLGPALIDAGLVEPYDAERFTAVEVPWQETFGRLRQASDRHTERLVDRQAWTCRPTEIERTVLPTEPSLVHGATTSTHIFGGWLETVDAIWLVRATCSSGPAMFVVTGHVDPDDGTVHDRILLAALAPPG